MVATVPGPVLERCGEFLVVRDDLLAGGSKERIADAMVGDGPGIVYASPGEGYAQIALALAATRLGRRAAIFTAARRRPHNNTVRAELLGAEMHFVRPGYLSVVQSTARRFADAEGLRYLPFGFGSPEARRLLTDAARPVAAECDPPEVWVAAGSGTLALALADAFPDAAVHAVRVGRELPAEVHERCVVHDAPERFAQRAEVRPPFPSAPEYDAKVWRFATAGAAAGSLIWNVAA